MDCDLVYECMIKRFWPLHEFWYCLYFSITDSVACVDIDQHQLDGGSGTLSYGGNNEDDS